MLALLDFIVIAVIALATHLTATHLTATLIADDVLGHATSEAVSSGWQSQGEPQHRVTLASLAKAMVYISMTMLCTFAMGLYQRTLVGSGAPYRQALAAAILSLGLWWPLHMLIFGTKVHLPAMVTMHATVFVVLLALRPLVCKLLDGIWGRRRIAVIGSLSFVDLARQIEGSAWPADFVISHVAVVDAASRPADVAGLARDTSLHEILVEADLSAGPSVCGALPDETLGRVRLTSKPEFMEAHLGRVESGAAFLNVANGWGSGLAAAVLKRLLDLSIALVGLLVALPILLLIALLIKLDDGGPIFYVQTRVGLRNRPFRLVKFRSMHVNAEGSGKAVWARAEDARTTRIGKILRRFRLDEFPQFVNVVRGEMSLVGPRPERPEFVESLEVEIVGYSLRHGVLPGLTGWAQINFRYGASLADAARKTEYDLYYIKHWSIWLDLAIMVQTLRVIVFDEGSR